MTTLKPLTIFLLTLLFSQALTAQSDIPRLASGKPDLNGVWARPYVPNMLSAGNGSNQRGPGEEPFTAAGLENFSNYNPSEGDYTGSCLPFGLLRAMNAPDPIQFMQTDSHFSYLYEQNTWFKVVNLDGEDHSGRLPPAWYGHSVASWDGDTLIITTDKFNGKTRLDTVGHPHSHEMTVTEKFTLRDADTMDYIVTIDDPIYYTKPWDNTRVFSRQTDFDLIEYSCMENNKSLFEGRVLPPDYDNWHTYEVED